MNATQEHATTTPVPVALIVGLDPAGAPDWYFPGADTSEAVERGIRELPGATGELRLALDTFLIDYTDDIGARFQQKLSGANIAIIVIGGGIRLEPSLTHLLETLVNCAHTNAPHAAICFNTGPETTIDAIRRWWPSSTPVPAL
ncbi:uncharacterized protein RMCC_5311 [Mycolicibacterium canariasense]|uniref:Uncharacterized protein n=1 Tax=Mycolicibacterium canariasense TaxID=228230 RepID=A0A100WHF1_MYCCR|nr:hypothetical protein [Mycolicibacterium canariasense]MCV7211816.1 hypothetical protein [Mycolicibacterium canariasense]ORV08122.1 hypothetical protein AWB94_12500 [Mycolicibacterium canariasense]GAS98346.1 uncharacterized protein RMCC_5311 [Mycolicibacterium canariasense]